MSIIKCFFLSSDCVATGFSGVGSCCLGMKLEGGLSLGSFLVPASFLTSSWSELRCFRRQIKAVSHPSVEGKGPVDVSWSKHLPQQDSLEQAGQDHALLDLGNLLGIRN